MNAAEPLLGAAVRVIVNQAQNSEGSQAAEESETTWRGRKVLYRVKNSLLGFGGVSALLCVGGFYAQINIPAIAFGIFAASAAVVSCTGGCCLWKTIPHKAYEDAVELFQRENEKLEKAKSDLESGLAEAQTQREELARQLQQSNEQLGKRNQEMLNITSQLEVVSARTESTVEAANNVTTRIQIENESLSINIASLKQVLDGIEQASSETSSGGGEGSAKQSDSEFLAEQRKIMEAIIAESGE